MRLGRVGRHADPCMAVPMRVAWGERLSRPGGGGGHAELTSHKRGGAAPFQSLRVGRDTRRPDGQQPLLLPPARARSIRRFHARGTNSHPVMGMARWSHNPPGRRALRFPRGTVSFPDVQRERPPSPMRFPAGWDGESLNAESPPVTTSSRIVTHPHLTMCEVLSGCMTMAIRGINVIPSWGASSSHGRRRDASP
jgi:hypothetical protein